MQKPNNKSNWLLLMSFIPLWGYAEGNVSATFQVGATVTRTCQLKVNDLNFGEVGESAVQGSGNVSANTDLSLLCTKDTPVIIYNQSVNQSQMKHESLSQSGTEIPYALSLDHVSDVNILPLIESQSSTLGQVIYDQNNGEWQSFKLHGYANVKNAVTGQYANTHSISIHF